VALVQIRAQGGVSIPGLISSLAIFLFLLIAAAVGEMNRARMPVNPPVQPNAQAQAQPAPQPPAAQADEPAPPQTEQPAPAEGGTTLDSSYLVGRWSDASGGCGSMFNNDGTFTADDGSRGLWNLTGDRLTLTGNSTLIVQVVPVDSNTMTLVKPDGSLIRATRC
jgi:hypothetical protein